MRDRVDGPWLARAYFAMQALLGAAWWGAVFIHDGLREATLGGASPRRWVVPDLLLFVVPSFLAAALPAGSRLVRVALAILLSWSVFILGFFGWHSLEAGRGAWGVVAMTFAVTGSLLAGMRLARGPLAAGKCFPLPFRIRPADEGSQARHALRTFLQILFFWGFFLGVLPWAIWTLEGRWNLRWIPLTYPSVAMAGWILFASQSLLGLWSAWEMVRSGRGTPLPSDTARELVTTGPYACVRNPMALAGVLQGVAVGLICGSWLVVVYALVGSLVWNTLARPYEEADLAARFGPAFEDYRSRVRCWMPRLRN